MKCLALIKQLYYCIFFNEEDRSRIQLVGLVFPEV